MMYIYQQTKPLLQVNYPHILPHHVPQAPPNLHTQKEREINTNESVKKEEERYILLLLQDERENEERVPHAGCNLTNQKRILE